MAIGKNVDTVKIMTLWEKFNQFSDCNKRIANVLNLKKKDIDEVIKKIEVTQ